MLTCAGTPAQVPVWFCIACPVVLGLLAPFVFNLGSGAVAQAICDYYSLAQDECNDVWCALPACLLLLLGRRCMLAHHGN